jgi:hypothetical protein
MTVIPGVGDRLATKEELDALVPTVAAEDVAFTPTGSIAATDVQAAIAEAASEGGGGGGASTIDPLGLGYAVTQHENGNATAALLSANMVQFQRCINGCALTDVIRISISVASGNVNVGVASGPVGLQHPNTREATSGSVACPAAASAVDIALSTQVDVYPGDWLFLGADNTTATFRTNGAGTGEGDINKGQTARLAGTYPCPTTPAPTTAPFRRFVLIGHTG